MDLPDLTIGNAASTAKVLSRKRPRRSLNVTAFEKRLKDGDGRLKALLSFHSLTGFYKILRIVGDWTAELRGPHVNAFVFVNLYIYMDACAFRC